MNKIANELFFKKAFAHWGEKILIELSFVFLLIISCMFKNINWLRFFVILVVELFLGMQIFYLYPVVSMLFFGEGSDSFLYSDTNAYLWLLSPSIFGVINFIIWIKTKTSRQSIANTYRLLFWVFMIVYSCFMIYWKIFHRFKI
ncbi:MAG: hypothetical protein C0459_02970 [Chitinophaga sp.]|nr:hypothetical protein [Chitinophaga sp.]